MTSEHVTITEEVVKDGQVVTQERVTLKTTPDPHDNPVTNAAMGVTHPDFVPATERVYTYNEATGMSESKPMDVVEPAEPEVEELEEDEPVTKEELEDEEISPEERRADDQSAALEYGIEELKPALCHHPIGNGECQLPEGHSGSHRMNVD